MEIYEDGIKIGTLQVEEDGLYTVFICKTEPSEKIRRVYIAYSYGVKYLGIPDRHGYFKTHISQKQIPKQYHAVSTVDHKGRWLPWRGEVDGVLIETALMADNEIAMPLNEAMKFPAWEMETTEINNKQMALLPLCADGVPLPREREAERNETVHFDNFVDSDFSDMSADDSVGGEGWQADCSDL